MIKRTKYLVLALVVILVGMQASAFAGGWSFSFGVSGGRPLCRPSYWRPAPVYCTPCCPAPCVVHTCRPQVVVVPQQVQYVPVSAPVEQNCYPVIKKIFECGELVELNDGSLWGVSPTGQYTSKMWHKGEKVALGRSGQYTFPNAMRNMQTGETVEVALKQTM